MSIKIIVDSASDITQEQGDKLGIQVMPLTIRFDQEEFIDGVNLNFEEFYKKMSQSKNLPKTSQITPYAFEEAFKEALKDNDAVICITLSKLLSGCYQSAIMAKENLENDNIYVIDSLQATVGERIVVNLVINLVNEGKSAKEIYEIVEQKKNDVRLIALVDTLEYLKKGGRISSTTAFFGTLLGVKPVIEIADGLVHSIGKTRGSKNANKVLRDFIEAKGGIDLSMPYEIGYAGSDNSQLLSFMENNKDLATENLGNPTGYVIGCTVGTYVGPGTTAVAFFAKNK